MVRGGRSGRFRGLSSADAVMGVCSAVKELENERSAGRDFDELDVHRLAVRAGHFFGLVGSGSECVVIAGIGIGDIVVSHGR